MPKAKEESIAPSATPHPVTPETVVVSAEEWAKTQEMLKMLYETADKGRIYNYESQQNQTKKPLKVHLSKFQDGIIVGWRTVKDQGVYHPTTGKQIGEEQEYELLLDKAGTIQPVVLNGYPAFSAARYTERLEAEVVGRKEDYDGKVTFDVKLPEGRTISLDARFVN